jgi:hypothetical protein
VIAPYANHDGRAAINEESRPALRLYVQAGLQAPAAAESIAAAQES